jgi:hypothetical protein
MNLELETSTRKEHSGTLIGKIINGNNMTIDQQFSRLQDKAEQIIGNVKGGIKQPSVAVMEIHGMYAELFNKMRYPGGATDIHTGADTI